MVVDLMRNDIGRLARTGTSLFGNCSPSNVTKTVLRMAWCYC